MSGLLPGMEPLDKSTLEQLANAERIEVTDIRSMVCFSPKGEAVVLLLFNGSHAAFIPCDGIEALRVMFEALPARVEKAKLAMALHVAGAPNSGVVAVDVRDDDDDDDEKKN